MSFGSCIWEFVWNLTRWKWKNEKNDHKFYLSLKLKLNQISCPKDLVN